MEISVIIPTYNEEQTIAKTLDAVSRLVNVSEIIIVDGGSTDNTVELAKSHGNMKKTEIIRHTKTSRGEQMHIGTGHATGDIFWFIFADSRPIQGAGKQIKRFLKSEEVAGGNFEVRFTGDSRWAGLMTRIYSQLRSTGLIYGESAIFTRRETYEEAGGFRDLPKFEDVDLASRLMKRGRFVYIKMPVTISSRRFANGSYLPKFLMWSVRQTLYWMGVPPRYLSRAYLPSR